MKHPLFRIPAPKAKLTFPKGEVPLSTKSWPCMRLTLAIRFLFSVITLACPTWATSAAATSYHLRPGDVLQITVAGHPELSFDSRDPVEIRSDGKFSYPFAGEIAAEGETVERITTLLIAALKCHLRDPQIVVNVIKYREEEIYVLGEVNKPGAYALPQDRGIGIREAIALAEGLTSSASRETARLFGAGESPKLIDLRKVLAGASEAEAVALQPGDTLVIKRRNIVSIIGEVERPGNYQLPDEGTVSDALAMAGGFAKDREIGGTRANKAEGVLIRADRATVPVNLAVILSGKHPEADMLMHTGDTLLVLEARNQIAVLGEVGAPGAYYLGDREKLAAVLAMAGGVTAAADLHHIRIICADGRLATVNYEPVLQEGAEEPEVVCAAGDTVIVPLNRNRAVVFGAVSRPGVYTIETSDTVLDLIGKAGGVLIEKSAPENTALIRQGTTEKRAIRINLKNLMSLPGPPEELMAQDGDVIFVPESKKLRWRDWTSIISSAAGLWWTFERF